MYTSLINLKVKTPTLKCVVHIALYNVGRGLECCLILKVGQQISQRFACETMKQNWNSCKKKGSSFVFVEFFTKDLLSLFVGQLPTKITSWGNKFE